MRYPASTYYIRTDEECEACIDGSYPGYCRRIGVVRLDELHYEDAHPEQYPSADDLQHKGTGQDDPGVTAIRQGPLRVVGGVFLLLEQLAIDDQVTSGYVTRTSMERHL